MADFECKECGFRSVDHDTKKQADARGKEHMEEHETGEAMREIKDFMTAQEKGKN